MRGQASLIQFCVEDLANCSIAEPKGNIGCSNAPIGAPAISRWRDLADRTPAQTLARICSKVIPSAGTGASFAPLTFAP